MSRTDAERAFLEIVKQFQDIGYGNMMSIISRQWYLELEKKYGRGAGGGAFVPYRCFIELSQLEQTRYMLEMRDDPLFMKEREG
jgi:hypothetical protein